MTKWELARDVAARKRTKAAYLTAAKAHQAAANWHISRCDTIGRHKRAEWHIDQADGYLRMAREVSCPNAT